MDQSGLFCRCREGIGQEETQYRTWGDSPDPRASHWSRSGAKGHRMMIFEGIMTRQHRFQSLLMENKHGKMLAFPHTLTCSSEQSLLVVKLHPFFKVMGGSPLSLLKGCREEGSQALAEGSVVLSLKGRRKHFDNLFCFWPGSLPGTLCTLSL